MWWTCVKITINIENYIICILKIIIIANVLRGVIIIQMLTHKLMFPLHENILNKKSLIIDGINENINIINLQKYIKLNQTYKRNINK